MESVLYVKQERIQLEEHQQLVKHVIQHHVQFVIIQMENVLLVNQDMDLIQQMEFVLNANQEKHHLENVLSGMPEEWWPLTMTLPDEQIIDIIGGRHLFLIVPSDEYAYVSVSRLQLGADGFTGNEEEVLYESMTGEPFLLRCNVYDFAMDSEICIMETDGDEYGWYPDVLPTGRIFQPQVDDAVYYDLTVYEEE